MFEDNSCEPLAEVYLSVSDDYFDEDVYCLCSRVVIRGFQEEEVTVQESNKIDETNKLINVSQDSTQSQPILHIKRKDHEEVLSCYCSASHCSTDEHDSIRENALHSDSGADLSESSKDLDWERYWATHGERIVWESWITKYGDYVDPNYIHPSQGQTEPYAQEETQFNISGGDSGNKTFSGFLDSINEENERYPNFIADNVVEAHDTVENSSEISDLGDEYFRLRSCSRSSGKSSLMTDSFTNITPMTIYSSELSCSTEESSGQSNSNSILSSSSGDSVGSNENKWQQLWMDHFNEQYIASYKCFVAKCTNEHISSETYGNIFEDIKQSNESVYSPKSQEADKFFDIKKQKDIFKREDNKENIIIEHEDNKENINKQEENKENIIVIDIPQDLSSAKYEMINSSKFKSSKDYPRQIQSVGNLLGSLKTLTMEQEVAEIPPVTCEVDEELDVNSEDAVNGNIASEDGMSEDEALEEMSSKQPSKNLKRVHEKEDSSLDKVKGAFTLMGYVFKPPSGESVVEEKRVRKAHVVYRKKNIRHHNRSLNLKFVQSRHIRFNDSLPIEDKVKKFLHLNNSAMENSSVEDESQTSEPIDKLSLARDDDFSEKDDSSSTEDAFFSADDLPNQTKLKERQKKKKINRKRKANVKNNLPKEIAENNKLLKYWYNRYRLFSMYDHGIKLDEESWYSVTPEKVSKHTAERCRCDLIIDACCGAGGNAIQFAFTCERVIAIDIDPEKVELAKHNASIYGVADRIDFITGNFFDLAPTLKGDVVFLSPPWGGPNYMSTDSFNLEDITVEGGGKALFDAAYSITPNIAYFLPKNINTHQLMQITGPGGSVEVEQNFLDKKFIAITAYFGELIETIEETN